MMMMSNPITFGGISSGLDTNAIVSSLIAVDAQPIQKMQTKVNSTQQKVSFMNAIKTRATTLQSNINKFVKASFLDADIFQSKTGTSSNKDQVDITAADTANVQGLSISVTRLASTSIARSSSAVGQAISNSTKLSDVKQFSFTSGNLSLYVGGTANTIAVDATVDTIGDVLNRIKGVAGIADATIDAQGRLSVTGTTPSTVRLGSGSDTSNFFRLSKLDTAIDSGSGVLQGVQPISIIDTSADISTAGANLATAVTAGSTFKVGKATFDTTGKSLSQLVEAINNSTDAGTSAVLNPSNNKLELTSKTTGNLPIYLEDTTGNFLAATGLITAGNSLSSQTLGDNAQLTVNGNTIYSTNNAVDASVSGLTGVTLNLKGLTVNTSGVQTPVNVTIGRDASKITTAINDFIKTYNDIVSTIDAQTNPKTGGLPNDSGLRSFRSQIRGLVSSVNNDATTYKSLQSIGITTGAVGANTTGATGATSALQVDATKLTDALNTNAADVKTLFSGTNGIFTNLKKIVDQTLLTGTDTTGKGLFQSSADSFQSQITRLNKQIADGNARLTKKEAAYRRQFTASDQLISQYQNQGRSLSSLSTNNSN
ncbi:MAG: flagellar filament capping protein FliD [Candidatus Melainabacteria bacterium]|nr:flagellar filament capping protein FliD [Candidatus Melainabacteria bacterium]